MNEERELDFEFGNLWVIGYSNCEGGYFGFWVMRFTEVDLILRIILQMLLQAFRRMAVEFSDD